MEEIMKVIKAFLKPACSDPGSKNISCEITLERNKEGGKLIVNGTKIKSIEFFPPG